MSNYLTIKKGRAVIKEQRLDRIEFLPRVGEYIYDGKYYKIIKITYDITCNDVIIEVEIDLACDGVIDNVNGLNWS